MKKILLLMVLLVMPLILFAEAGPGTDIGPSVSKYNGEDLKWEKGSWDYFVMFKTLLKNADTSNDTAGNPQADACLTEAEIMDSTNGLGYYTLDNNLIPDDAYVSRAFLVWMGSVPDAARSKDTDNQVKLTFNSTASGSDGIIIKSEEITAPQAYKPGINKGFDYESVIDESDANNPLIYYTYRVDVTDFFESLHQKGREAGFATNRDAIAGKYFVSGLTCAADESYVRQSTLVSNWALFVVYTSEQIKPKNIYIYNGVNTYYNWSSKITVGGFQLPKDPTVRVSLMVAEGDPGNYSPTLPFKERLAFSGDSTVGKIELTNKCNPKITGDYSYTEIYNSISSSYDWQGVGPTCIGGDPSNPDPAKLEYAIDIDTFVLNSDEYPGHLILGDTDMDFEISANQDLVVSNMMVVSVDTKPAVFDIPKEAEKMICSCSGIGNKTCEDRPFYFYIKVQNWGSAIAKDVVVKDELANNYKYIPGTTEYTYQSNNGDIHDCWKPIADGAGSSFPLSGAGYTIPFAMSPCSETNTDSCDTVYIRFKVDRPDGTSYWDKGEKITNQATIQASGSSSYSTNSGVPLQVGIDMNCPLLSTCAEPDMNSCVEPFECGDEDPDEHPDEDTPPQLCQTTSAGIIVAEGKNSSDNDKDGITMVASVTNNIPLGQFTVTVQDEAAEPCENGEYPSASFKTAILTFAAESGMDLATLSNFRLVYDANANGIYDATETVAGTASAINGANLQITVNKDLTVGENRAMMHYFLILADLNYTAEVTSSVPTFQASVASGANMVFSDAAGNLTANLSGKVSFEKFGIQSSSSGIVIFTKGLNDADVPYSDTVSSANPVMQIRTSSVGTANKITSINVTTVNSDDLNLYLGEGIPAISLWLDSDGDGKIGGADSKLGETTFDEYTDSYTFPISLDLPADTDKYLILAADLTSLTVDDKVQFKILGTGVKLETTASIQKLPIASKIFSISCPDNDMNCMEVPNDPDCSCSTVQSGNNVNWKETLAFSLLAMMLALLALRKTALKR